MLSIKNFASIGPVLKVVLGTTNTAAVTAVSANDMSLNVKNGDVTVLVKLDAFPKTPDLGVGSVVTFDLTEGKITEFTKATAAPVPVPSDRKREGTRRCAVMNERY